MTKNTLCALLIIAGMAGLAAAVEFSGWVLFTGLAIAWLDI